MGIGFEGHDIVKPWAVFDTSIEGWADTFEANFVYLDRLPIYPHCAPWPPVACLLRPRFGDSDLIADAALDPPPLRTGGLFRRCAESATLSLPHQDGHQVSIRSVFLAGDAAHLCSPSQGHGMTAACRTPSTSLGNFPSSITASPTRRCLTAMRSNVVQLRNW